MSNASTQAGIIARSAKSNMPQFDFIAAIPVITMLIQFLSQCWKDMPSGDGSSSAARYVADHYDASSDAFEPSLVSRVRPQTRRAIRHDHRDNNGRPLKSYSQEEITAITEQTLRRAMTDEAATASCLAETIN